MDDSLILGRYRPLEKAGAGAFGTVQVAWDTTIQRKVAIKCISLSAADAIALADGARDSGAVSRGTGAYAGGDPYAGEYADGYADGYADDFAGVGLDGWDDAPADDYWADVRTSGRYFDGEGGRGIIGSTVKLPDTQLGMERGRGITPLAPEDYAEDGTKLSEHWLTDLPGLDEARTAALLSDAHIVAVYDFQVVGRMAYLIMEYVEGMTLTRFLRKYDDDLSLDIIGAVFADVAQALTVAHTSGVLHLDIKPDNVLIDKRGQVKVTDFGLATLADEMGYGLAGGGTIGYMPPEQMHQEHLDARTDEWALASITYEMLTGKNPFVSADTLDEALALIDDAELVLPSLCWRGLDARIDDVVFRALDPERDERYDSVAEFAEALQPYLGDVAAGHEALADVVAGAQEASLLETAVPGLAAGGTGTVDLAEAAANAYAEVDARATEAAASGGLLARFGRHAREDCEEAPRLPVYVAPSAGGEADAPGAHQAKRAADRDVRPTASRAGGHFFGIWARVIGFFFCGALMLLACLNVPLFSTFQEPFIGEVLEHIWPAALEIPALQNSFLWALVVACAVLAAIKPSWGAVAALTGFGIAITWSGNALMGLLFLLITWLWWYCTGRHGGAQANCGLSFPLLGSVGCAPFSVLATGIGMRVLDAAMTALFGIFACMVCACLGSGDIMDWQLGQYWNFAADDVSAAVGITLGSVRNWVIAASWLLAAAVGGVCTMPRRRWINIVGTVAAVALVVGGLFLGTWIGSAHTVWAPETWQLVKTLLCCAAGIGAACAFIPEPYVKKQERVKGVPRQELPAEEGADVGRTRQITR